MVIKVIHITIDDDWTNTDKLLAFIVPTKDFNLIAGIRQSIKEYIKTPQGKETYKANGEYFNWGLFEEVPNEILRQFGFERANEDYFVEDTAYNDFDEDLSDSADESEEDETQPMTEARLIEIAESMDISVSILTSEIEFEFCSNAGEDVVFSVNNNIEQVAATVREYADAFDIDEHAITNFGVNGAPLDLQLLLDDAKDIKKKLLRLADMLD